MSSHTADEQTMPDATDRLTVIYEAFNARDVDRVLRAMATDVDWPNGWEGGRVVGHEAVREYWQRQWAAIDPKVTPVSFAELPDGRVRVQVHQVVHDQEGQLLADTHVVHTYSFADGLIQSMQIEG